MHQFFHTKSLLQHHELQIEPSVDDEENNYSGHFLFIFLQFGIREEHRKLYNFDLEDQQKEWLYYIE